VDLAVEQAARQVPVNWLTMAYNFHTRTWRRVELVSLMPFPRVDRAGPSRWHSPSLEVAPCHYPSGARILARTRERRHLAKALRASPEDAHRAEDGRHSRGPRIEGWLHGKAERAATIGSFGTNVTDYVAADGSNNVAIIADIRDMAGAPAIMASPSPETAAQMESHGVLPPGDDLHREV